MSKKEIPHPFQLFNRKKDVFYHYTSRKVLFLHSNSILNCLVFDLILILFRCVILMHFDDFIGYSEQIENAAAEILERLEPLRIAAKSEAENLGHAVVQLVSNKIFIQTSTNTSTFTSL